MSTRLQLCAVAYLVLLALLAWLYRRYYRQNRELAALLAERNELLRERERTRSTYFAHISHEFRTPLTLILGPLSEAIDRVREFSLREQLRMAHRNAGQLLRLVEELRARSRLEADRLKIDPASDAPIPKVTAHARPDRSPGLAPAMAAESFQSPASAERPAVLVIEDRADMRNYLRHLLVPHFHVSTVDTTRAAQRLLERGRFQLVLTGLMLPGEDGIAFLERVRSGQTVYRHIPFIILTARASPAERQTCLRLGIDDFLTKPFEATELIARIHNVLRNRETRGVAHPAFAKERSVGEQLVRNAETAVNRHLDDSDFGATQLARSLGYGLRSLERRLKEYTGLSPARFIREIRLRAAYRLLEQGHKDNVSEVGLATGFASAAHFSRVFSRRFGVPPSEVLGRAREVEPRSSRDFL